MAPVLVMRPIAPFPAASVNHRLPSGPLAIAVGLEPHVSPLENSDAVPPLVMRPTEPNEPISVNQRLLPPPAVIPLGCSDSP